MRHAGQRLPKQVMVAAADGGSIVIPPEYQIAAYVGRTNLWRIQQDSRGVRVMDTFAGIATMLLCLVQAKIPVTKYWYNEYEARTRDVAAAAVAKIQQGHPQLLPMSALEDWDIRLPSDISILAREAQSRLADMRVLPNFLAGAIPCTDTSLAGEGAGLRANSRSSLVFEFVTVAHHLYREYKRRGWQQPHAPFVWMVETSAVMDVDSRPTVREAMQALEAMLGEPVTVDAVWAGAGCHRRTMIFSNMTDTEEQFAAIAKAPAWDIITPIAEYLEPGERYQIMEAHHMSPHYPFNKLGCYLERFPKFVRYPNSYKFRADYYGSGKHGPGRILLEGGETREPTLRMKCGALCYPNNYAAHMRAQKCPDEIRVPRGRGDMTETPEKLQHQLYGNCFAPPLITRILKEALQSGGRMAERKQERRASSAAQGATAVPELASEPPAPTQQHQVIVQPPPTTPNKETVQSRGLPSLADTVDAKVDEDYWLLGNAEVDYVEPRKTQQLLPPAMKPPRRIALPAPLPESAPEIKKAMAHLDAYFQRVDQLRKGATHAVDQTPPAEWERWLQQDVIRPEQHFVTGNLHRHAAVWEMMVSRLPPSVRGKALCKRVMRLIRNGMELHFVHPRAAIQQSHPRYKQRLTRAIKALTRVYGDVAAKRLIERKTPGEVRLPNMRSYEDHLPFVLETLQQDLLPKGKVTEWWWPEGKPPTVISPIGVDVRPVTGKRRLVFDHNYVNLFCRYQKMQYETLDDLVSMADEDGFGSTGDTASGYHHIAIADKFVPYFGFMIEGVCYVYLCCPFGTAPAPSIYTDITTFQFQYTRSLGLKLVTFIDDWATVAATRAEGQFNASTVHLLLAALGWALSTKKLQLSPARYFEFLGLGAQLGAPARFIVPAQKMDAILQLLQALIDKQSVTFREIAQVAGKIISIRRAVHLAPLICRDLWSALVGIASWDEVFSSPAGCLATFDYLVENLEQMNGRRIWARQRGVIVAGDASAVGFGAYPVAVDAVIPADPDQLHIPSSSEMEQWGLHPFRTSFSKQDAELAESNQYSSSSRELDCLLAWLRTVAERKPNVLQHSAMLYLTDSQVAAADVNKMAGSQTTLPIVREIWKLCARLDLELEAKWLPREHYLMRQADRDSKVADESSWAISDWHFEFLCALWQVQPTLDPFADNINHRAKRFFSLDLCPGTAGLDAFRLPWSVPGERAPVAWVNPPFHKMHEVITKLEAERVKCILIAPEWNKSWVARLLNLPVVSKQALQTKDSLGNSVSIFTPGSRVPRRQQSIGHRHNPKYTVWAYLLEWPETEVNEQGRVGGVCEQ